MHVEVGGAAAAQRGQGLSLWGAWGGGGHGVRRQVSCSCSCYDREVGGAGRDD